MEEISVNPKEKKNTPHGYNLRKREHDYSTPFLEEKRKKINTIAELDSSDSDFDVELFSEKEKRHILHSSLGSQEKDIFEPYLTYDPPEVPQGYSSEEEHVSPEEYIPPYISSEKDESLESENSKSGSEECSGSEEPSDGNLHEQASTILHQMVPNLLPEVPKDYFKYDSRMLKDVVFSHIVTEFPDIDKDAVSEVLDVSLKMAGGLVDEYSEAIPADERWKVKVTDKEKVKKLEPFLTQIRDDMEIEEPTMEKILELCAEKKVSKKDSMLMVQLFDIYHNLEPYTREYLDARLELTEKLEMHSRCVSGMLETVENEENRLGKNIPLDNDTNLKNRIFALDTSDEVKARLLEYQRKLSTMCQTSETYAVLKDKLEWGVSLPYAKMSLAKMIHGSHTIEEMNEYCSSILEKLDEELYGIAHVKDELICMLNDRITNPNAICTLALKGVQGTGKTSIFAAFAKAVGLPFERIALGGMEDSSILKGTHGHWVGSEPSIILQILKRMKIANGLVLFDEIDKLGGTTGGQQIQNALLHITDYTQNKEFQDAFLNDYPHDISNLWFVFAMNDENLISPILRDRLTIREIEPYTLPEMREIIKKHIIPKALENVNIPKTDVTISDDAATLIVNTFNPGMRDGGVRNIQKATRLIITRINMLRTNTLPDGTTGKLKLNFSVPNFKLPLQIDKNVVMALIDKPKVTNLSYFA